MESIIDPPGGWRFVPAPPDLDEPSYSFESYRIPLYPPEVVADAILPAPGMQVVRPAESSWEDWKARWEDAGRFIELGINALDAESNGASLVASRYLTYT
jgi:hypothetical protein